MNVLMGGMISTYSPDLSVSPVRKKKEAPGGASMGKGLSPVP